MGVERADDRIDSAISDSDGHPPPPPDRPGVKGYPSRADSRKGAADASPGAQGTEEQLPDAPQASHEISSEGYSGATEEKSEVRDKSANRADAPDLRTTIWDLHPGDYNPPSAAEEHAVGDRQKPFEQPASWIADINPGYGDPNKADRDYNCADCARSVERNWRGESQVAAGLLSELEGELNHRTETWADSRFQKMDFAEIETRLEAGGHGSSAIVGVDWKGGGGHYFNAVNAHGEILALDGQSGRVERWPPSMSGLRYDASRVEACEAIVRDPRGKDL